VRHDRFHLCVAVQGLETLLTAVTGVLDAAESANER